MQRRKMRRRERRMMRRRERRICALPEVCGEAPEAGLLVEDELAGCIEVLLTEHDGAFSVPRLQGKAES